MGGGAARGGHGTASASSTASNGNEKEALKLIWCVVSVALVFVYEVLIRILSGIGTRSRTQR